MKESFRQWANKSGGNPVAFGDLMNYPINLAGFVIMALWNTLESMNLLFPKSMALIIIVNIFFDVLLNVYLFCHILRTNPLKQHRYLFALVAWNMLDVGFNFLMAIPDSMVWVMVIRCIVDVLVNAGIVILCYRRPESHDFVPVIDQVMHYNESIAGTINTTYSPSKDAKGFNNPPNSTIKPIKELNIFAEPVAAKDVVEEKPSIPAQQTEPESETTVVNAERISGISDVYRYQYLDRLSECWDMWSTEGDTNSRKDLLFDEVKSLHERFPEYNIAYKDLCDQVERVRNGTIWYVVPSSIKTIKEDKERYASMI